MREVADDDRCRVLASDYVATVAAGKSALVVSPTHREGKQITAEIRNELKKLGRLKTEERSVLQLHNANLTEAQRADDVNYLPGDVLEFHQNAKGFRKGRRVVVGREKLPLDRAARFQAFNAGELCLSPGEMVRITKNGLTTDGRHRLNNGARYTVKGFNSSGDLILDNGWAVSKDFGHLDYGYVVTSHVSQGKTVDCVFVGQSSLSFPASSREPVLRELLAWPAVGDGLLRRQRGVARSGRGVGRADNGDGVGGRLAPKGRGGAARALSQRCDRTPGGRKGREVL